MRKRPLSAFNCRGFTLVEAMIATFVLLVATVALTSAYTSGATVYAEGPRQTLAAQLASDLMEEIVNTPFDEIVGKYGNQVEQKGEVKDATGEIFTNPSYSNFSRKVECRYVYVDQQTGNNDPTFILAAVVVYYSGREIANIKMLIGAHDGSSTIDFL